MPGYQFNVHWNSTISVQNLVLRPDVLQNLQLPVRVTSGIVGEISIEGIFSGQLMLRVQQIIIEVAPGIPNQTDTNLDVFVARFDDKNPSLKAHKFLAIQPRFDLHPQFFLHPLPG